MKISALIALTISTCATARTFTVYNACPDCTDFDDPVPAKQCLNGGCNGGLECDPKTGGGVPPVTSAEFTLQAPGFVDYFDRNSPNYCSGCYDSPVTLAPHPVSHITHTSMMPAPMYMLTRSNLVDDATGRFTCDSNLAADYTVTFCPAS
ncbi:hypothetical protein EW026_g2220 [Hermanssonia centrifuga]|uniref:Uncharacterized protein n=1 Tax=Hermanssonia centrifuga TaxID=98765 RepID=A0A4S4KP02_9APHY|nr:hypothetical protein EW026_g2220 [Hermanssonia centrifuga]